MRSTTAIYNLLVDDYDELMMHRIPVASSVERSAFIRDACRGKRVLDIGGSGPLAKLIQTVAVQYANVDKTDATYCLNLDKEPVPVVDVDLVVCGEVVEHLSNPGFFLDGLRAYTVPILFSVPNSMTAVGQLWIKKGIENVNADHVAYYSYYTFSNLLKRHGFKIEKFCWYNGQPGIAEGLIFCAR